MYFKYIFTHTVPVARLKTIPGPENQSYTMRHTTLLLAVSVMAISLFTHNVTAAEPAAKPQAEEINKICPISGKPADPHITVVYEGKTYAF